MNRASNIVQRKWHALFVNHTPLGLSDWGIICRFLLTPPAYLRFRPCLHCGETTVHGDIYDDAFLCHACRANHVHNLPFSAIPDYCLRGTRPLCQEEAEVSSQALWATISLGHDFGTTYVLASTEVGLSPTTLDAFFTVDIHAWIIRQLVSRFSIDRFDGFTPYSNSTSALYSWILKLRRHWFFTFLHPSYRRVLLTGPLTAWTFEALSLNPKHELVQAVQSKAEEESKLVAAINLGLSASLFQSVAVHAPLPIIHRTDINLSTGALHATSKIKLHARHVELPSDRPAPPPPPSASKSLSSSSSTARKKKAPSKRKTRVDTANKRTPKGQRKDRRRTDGIRIKE